MASDDDTIFIDVVPRVDDSAADSAVEKLKDKFKDVAEDVGPEFVDALRNSGVLSDLGTQLGKSLSDSLSDPLHDISDKIGVDLDTALEKAINKDWGGLSGVVGKGIGGKIADVLGVSDIGDQISDKLGINIEAALDKALNKDWGGVAGVVGKGLGGKLGDALGINDLLGPDGLGGVLDKAQNVADAVKGFKGGDVSSGLRGITSLFGAGGQATPLHDQLQQYTDTATGVHSLLGGTGVTLPAGIDKFVGKLPLVGDAEQSVEQLLGQAHDSFPTTNADPNKNPHGLWGTFFGAASNLMPWVHDSPTSQPAQPNSTDRLYDSVFGAGASASGGSTSTTANEVEVQSSVATISAGTVTLGGSISLPSTGSSVSSGGGHSSPSGIGKAYGSEGGAAASLYGGGGSSTLLDHFASGGILPGDSPGHDNILGYSGGAPVGLEGGEFIVNPQATQANHGPAQGDKQQLALRCRRRTAEPTATVRPGPRRRARSAVNRPELQ